MREDRLLELDARRRVYECVQRFPGLHLRELARELTIDPNHAKYHLRHLETHGLVSSRKEDGYWRFWPREKHPLGTQEKVSAPDKAVLSLLRRAAPLNIVVLLLDLGSATLGELEKRVGMAYSTLYYHLGKLEKVGLVESEKVGRERLYRLKDAAHVADLLVSYRPPDSLIQGFLEAWEQLELD